MALTDETIKKNIMDQLYWDHRVDAAKVTVAVDRSRVVLGGHVPTVLSRYAAAEDARYVAGVTIVENTIQVMSTKVPSDDQTTQADVVKAMALNDDLDAGEVAVFVRDGVVTLEGGVMNRPDIDVCEHTAMEIPGVEKVVNRVNFINNWAIA